MLPVELLKIPPPLLLVKFCNNVLFITLMLPVELLKIPPPLLLVLPLMIANPSIVTSVAPLKLNTRDELFPLTVSKAFPGASMVTSLPTVLL